MGARWAVALAAVTMATLAWPATASVASASGTIVSWTDGDTVRVRLAAGVVKVRLIGIDAPEASLGARAARQGGQLGRDATTIAALGRQAAAAARRLAPPGTTVRLETDVQTHDRYGRLLAYLWLPDGRLVNEILVREGWAMVLAIPPNVKYADRFLRAQQEARAASRGLWAQ